MNSVMSRSRGCWQSLFVCVVLAASAIANAQQPPQPTRHLYERGRGQVTSSGASTMPQFEYAKRLETAQNLTTLDSGLFGDSVNLYNGSLQFSAVDVSLPGNSGLPVQVARSYSVKPRSTSDVTEDFGGFGPWDLDIPYIYGTFTDSWQTTGGAFQRCSRFEIPIVGSGSVMQAKDFWAGVKFHLPGIGDQEVLSIGNSTALQPRQQVPSDGQTYRLGTRDFHRIRCKSSTANGQPGEGFIVVDTQGTTYTLDVVLSRYAGLIRKPYSDFGYEQIGRQTVYVAVSRVEDRFGNFVNYTWQNNKLTAITANDGRQITLTWTGNNVTSVTAVSAAQGSRSWIYTYPTNGLTVTQPDGSTWELTGFARQDPNEQFSDDSSVVGPNCPEPLPVTRSAVYQLKHPSGAVGAFSVEYRRHYRSGIPNTACYVYSIIDNSLLYELGIPDYFDTFSITQKQIAGPGLPTMTWQYAYGPLEGSGGSRTSYNAYAGNPCPPGTCPQSKTITVKNPDGSEVDHKFGVVWEGNDTRLLSTTTRGSASPSDVLRVESSEYMANAAAASALFPDTYGTSLVTDDGQSIRIRPVVRADVVQQGVTFTRQITGFDAFVKPTAMTDSSTLGYSRQTQQTYAQHLGKWVIGLPDRTTNVNTGLIVQDIDYHATSMLPKDEFVFGRRAASYTFNTDGTFATIVDGRNLTTTLSNWKRGIPQLIQYPDLTSKSALVNDWGWITRITDQNGFHTNFGHDLMGRTSQVTPPAGDTVAWTGTTISYTRATATAMGLPAGHWKRSESRGNFRKETWYDGLLRPVVEREWDNANATATQRFRGWRYDDAGRVTFEGYPRTTATGVGSFTAGTTSTFDALGRPTTISQTSELPSALTTTYAYLSDFRTQVTLPRGASTATTTSFQAFESPDTSNPTVIVGPEGVTTTIVRDVFGKPTSLTRSGGGNSITRTYAYDPQQRLCKQIDPETAATIFDYDGNNNIVWSTTGLSLTGSATSCDREWVGAAEKTVRMYDALNRITLVNYPDYTTDVSTTYTPDGLIDTLTSVPHVWKYTYNRLRLPTLERLEHTYEGFVYPYDTSWTYNALGHRASMIAANGTVVAYNPNALGQSTTAGSFASGATYFPDGSLKGFTYGNGTVRTITQNARMLPNRIADIRSGVTLLDDRYVYDANGNLTNQDDQLNLAGGDRSLSYDYRDRLISAQISGSQTETFTYDALDNIRSRQFGSQVSTYNYGTAWRLASITGFNAQTFTYDARGNMITRGGRTHIFDRANRLVSVSSVGGVDHEYDGHGRRTITWRSDGTGKTDIYTMDGVLRMTGDNRRSGNTVYVHLGNQLVAERFVRWDGTGEATEYVHGDIVGSSVARTTTTGVVTERERSLSFGQALDGSKREAPGFTGHMEDPGIGLVYMQQRYYDPAIGRFLSVDPVGPLSNPINHFGRYHYANNNPYRYTDPNGEAATAFVLGGFWTDVAVPEPSDAALPKWGGWAIAIVGAIAIDAAMSESGEGTEASAESGGGSAEGNTNPYEGPVESPVVVVDGDGNAIPVETGEQITSSPNGDYQQVRDQDGNATGVRLDRGGHKGHADPKANAPHGHRPGVTDETGNPHLPINPRRDQQ